MKRNTKLMAAGIAGAALLIGGGSTLALWNADALLAADSVEVTLNLADIRLRVADAVLSDDNGGHRSLVDTPQSIDFDPANPYVLWYANVRDAFEQDWDGWDIEMLDGEITSEQLSDAGIESLVLMFSEEDDILHFTVDLSALEALAADTVLVDDFEGEATFQFTPVAPQNGGGPDND